MTDIHSPEDLIEQLRPVIDFAAEQAWAHALKVGWDKAYPMLTADTSLPITLNDLRQTYEGLAESMYERLQEYAEDHPLHPEDRAEILWVSYADFTGAVILSPNRNPLFKFGILW